MSYASEEERHYAQYVSGYVWAHSRNPTETFPFGLGSGNINAEVAIGLAVSDNREGLALRSRIDFQNKLKWLVSVVPQYPNW